ncbi:ZIP family metal transporter, partial [Rubripirellula sp.]|nr:ZIP family metal transporter [Rubripirellula sp.]
MNTTVLLIVYCGLIAAVSLLGGRLSSLLRMTHLRTQLLMSGVGGLMLGTAMLHLLPHAMEMLDSPSQAGIGALAGLLFMFLLVRLFHTHDHGVPAVENDDPSGGHDHHDHHHHHRNPNHDHGDPAKGISWFGLFFGLLLHTLVDGIALSASVMAESNHDGWIGLAGLGTFLAVALHKPLDAFAITSVMIRQHWSARAQWLANVAFSLACPVGALAFFFGGCPI